MSHEHEQPGLAAVERTLASVAPTPPRIDRDRLMFLAGAASATPGSAGASPSHASVSRTGAWLWPASTAALAATSLALAMALLVRPDPPQRIVGDRPAANPVSPPAPSTSEQPSIAVTVARRREPSDLPANNYLRSRDVALRLGLDALGSPAASGGGLPAPTYRTWLESFAAPQPTSPASKPESSQM
jgi:hypothetical protein